MGTITFTGLAGYAAYLRLNTPKHDKMQRLYLGCVSIGSLGLAVWRFNTQ